MESKRQSSWKTFVAAAAVTLLAATAAPAAPDAPHDGGNNIGCMTCHLMTSTYPKLLPPLGGPQADMDDTNANRVCLSCHTGVGSSLIVTDTHSSLTTSPKYGNWTVECWVCHNEHMQEQNRYNGSTYGKFIRRSINLANIKKADGTSLGKTGIKPVKFLGQTGANSFADGGLVRDGICEVCHTQTLHFRNDASLAGNEGTHAGYEQMNCTTCHSHGEGFIGGADHSTFITDDNQVGDTNVKCSNCHTNYAAKPELAHSACTACHTISIPELQASTFPNANGQPDWDGVGGVTMIQNLTDAAIAPYTQYSYPGYPARLTAAGLGISDVGFPKIRCGECHKAKPQALADAIHGGHPASDWDFSAIVNDCVDCHDDGGQGTVKGIHNDTCTICHVNPAGGDYTRKLGDATKGVDGDARLASGRAGDCLTCHPGASYTKTHIHHDTANAVATPTNNCTTACHNTTTGHAGNHDSLVAIQNPPCQGCHNAAAASGGNNVPVDATSGNLVHDYCTSCHVNPSGNLIGTVATPTAHATTMNNPDGTTSTSNGGGTCTACHTAYFEGHDHGTAGAPEHSMSTVALCLNCHTATTVPYLGATEVHNTSGCYTCHDAGTGALKGSAVSAVGGENCQGCHTGYFNNHKHGDPGAPEHSMAVTSLCGNCHNATGGFAGNAADAATVPYTGVGEVHNASSCQTCHNAATGQRIAGTNGDATVPDGGDGIWECAECHSSYFNDHNHDHTATVVVNTGSATYTTNCINCHTTATAGTGPFTSSVHSTGSCATCHSNLTGALQGSAGTADNTSIAADAKYECGECHSAYFNGHTQHTATTHDVTQRAGTDLSEGTACNACHRRGGTFTANPLFTNTWGGNDGIYGLHRSDCKLCHDSTRDNTSNPGTVNATYGSVFNVIKTATNVGCLDCHADRVNGHGHNATHFGWDADCAACHSANPGSPTEEVVKDVHSATCTLCHDTGLGLNRNSEKVGANGDGDATLANGAATAPTPFNPAVYTCKTCHNQPQVPGFHGITIAQVTSSHQLSSNSSGGYDCETCHSANVANEQLSTHMPADTVANCAAICHTNTTASVPTGKVAKTVIDTVTWLADPNTNNTRCEDCHAAKGDYRRHGLTDDTGADGVVDVHNQLSTSGITGVTDCANCHSMADITARLQVHTRPVSGAANTCLTCHVGQGNPANAQIADGIAGNPVNCNECHTAKGVYTLHGLTEATVDDVHDKFGDSTRTAEKYCGNCHITTSAANRLDLHVNCLYCHAPGNTTYVNPTPTTTGTTAPTVVNNGRSTGGNTLQTCENCHATKGDYSMHGLTDDSGADGVADVHNNFNSANGQTVTYTGKLSGAYGGLKVSSYSCGDCHAPDPNTKTFSDLNVLQLHTRTNGTGIGDCLTCHVTSDHNSTSSWMTVIKSGRSAGTHLGGGGNALVECEDCHQAAYDADTTSGEKMYQYDGVRHHKTANAQAGNCTYCHADPRPTDANPGANPYPYAATADTVGTYQTGWNSDYSLGYGGTIPKQAACRLCHTNYGTDGAGTPWSVNVLTTKGNQGYNLTGTAGQRTTGLTVWANDFNAGDSGVAAGSTSTDVVNASKVVQSQIHRIEPNNGTAMINVNDYGSCLGCHSVQVMHAAPVPGADYPNPITVPDGTCGAIPWDTLRYAPGRAVFNRLRGGNDNNQAWNNHRLQNQNGIQTLLGNTCQNRGKNYLQGSEASTWNFSSTIAHTALTVPLHASVTNFNTQTGAQAMYFTDITTPTLDDITITRAEYVGSTVVVYATNTLGSGQTLSFTYTGGGCGTTAMTWSAANSRYEGTCNTPSGYTEGTDSVTVSNTTTTSPLDTRTRLVDLAGVAATAVNDNLTSAATGGPYPLAVLANDTGTSLKVASVGAVTKSSGAGTCGTVANNISSVGYTPGGGDAVCTFTYQAQAYNGAAPYGAPSQATVTVTQSVNTPPTLSLSQPSGQTGQSLASPVAITYTLTDPDNVVTASFSLDTDTNAGNGTGSAITCTGGTGAGAEGTNVTCTWNASAIATGGNTYYVYGVTNDGINPPVGAYSGSITFASCGTLAQLADWSSVANGTTGTVSGSYSVGAGSGTSRLLIVSVATETTAPVTTTWNVTYGGQALTPITSYTNNGGRINQWIGYLNEAGLDAAGNTTLSATIGGGSITRSAIHAAVYDYVNQTNPLPSTNSAASGANTNRFANNNVTIGPLAWAVNDQPVYSASNQGAQTITVSTAGYTESLESNYTDFRMASGYRTDVSTAGSESITFTWGGNGGSVALGAVLQSECNNN